MKKTATKANNSNKKWIASVSYCNPALLFYHELLINPLLPMLQMLPWKEKKEAERNECVSGVSMQHLLLQNLKILVAAPNKTEEMRL
eukprot:14273733-Ditylum_brightwellii.AAC.1